MLKLLVVAVVAGVITAATESEWVVFKTKYDKQYAGDIDLFRRAIWEDNLKIIQSHNELYAKGETSFYMGENEFTDMTHEEFSNTMKGFIMPDTSSEPRKKPKRPIPRVGSTTPAEVNWVKRGKVNPIQNQKGCNASYAFAAITAAESGITISYGGPLSKGSEQQAIDCTDCPHCGNNHGCKGGTINGVLGVLVYVDSEASYPYTAKAGKCKDGNYIGMLDGYNPVDPRTEAYLKKVVAYTVASAAINGGLESFRHYKGGVYDDPNCDATHLDHAVAVVGYGAQDNQDYWMIRNSWGTSWGMEGYMDLARNKNNTCGITSLASFPIIWA